MDRKTNGQTDKTKIIVHFKGQQLKNKNDVKTE